MERERGGDHMTAERGAVMWCMLDLTRFHPPAPRVRDLLSYVSPPLSCRPALMCSSFPFTGSRRAQLNNSAQHDRAGERNCSAHSVRHRLPQITGHRESSERHVRLFFSPLFTTYTPMLLIDVNVILWESINNHSTHCNNVVLLLPVLYFQKL